MNYDIITVVLLAVLAVLQIVVLVRKGSDADKIQLLGDMLSKNQSLANENQENKLDDIKQTLSEKQETTLKSVGASMHQLEERLRSFEQMNEQKLEGIRANVDKHLVKIGEDNQKQLEQMRKTVDEKLQKNLDEKINQSFKLVSERLEQVYKGLGEMQSLASGVGDLKKVLSNVKTRGILGEIQLGAILKEILSPEQYEENIVTVPNSRNPVEFAVKLPKEDSGSVYLPIDSKFPLDAYRELTDAYESGDAEAVKAARKTLSARVKQFAKDVHEKYVEVPYTTEFAIIFLPVEGVYAELVNMGMVEILQREYKVNICGPSTMAAFLNSLQMGFKTLAIEKRSAEVWMILGAVKKEFESFDKILTATQTRLDQANAELDKLVGVRTRAIVRKLKSVESIDGNTSSILEIEE